jgi:parvulin-like peptidyl-prolyl isomerase
MVQGDPKKIQGGGLYRKLALILLLLGGLSFGELVDRVVANVNGEPILESDLKVARIFYGPMKREELLKKLVDNHLIAQYLRSQGMSLPEGYLDAVIRDIARSNHKTVDQLYAELYREGLTPEDLRSFLSLEILANTGFAEFMKKRIKVSELEIEIERLKKGEVEYKREIELLVIPKGRKEEVLRALSEVGTDLTKLSSRLRLSLERLEVGRGDLVEPLEEEVWRVGVGQIAVAEDEENLYLAKVLKEKKLYSGRSEEEIREEILRRKIQRERIRVLEKLRKESLVEILLPREQVVSSPP